MGRNLFLFAGFIFFLLLLAYGFTKKRKRIFVFGLPIINDRITASIITTIKQLVQSEGLGDKIEIIPAIFAGDKIYDLYLRLEEILPKNPNVVVLYSGSYDTTENDLNSFDRFYTSVVDKLLQPKCKVILCTPLNQTEAYSEVEIVDEAQEQTTAIIKKTAIKKRITVLDLKSELQQNSNNNSIIGFNTTNNATQVIAETIWYTVRELK
jgi:hypothetical protein